MKKVISADGEPPVAFHPQPIAIRGPELPALVICGVVGEGHVLRDAERVLALLSWRERIGLGADAVAFVEGGDGDEGH